MRLSIASATLWSLTNVALLLHTTPAPNWSMIGPLITLIAPAVVIAQASRFAGMLRGGLLDRIARDRDQPTAPIIVAFLGWLLLAIQSTFLVTRV